MPYTLDAILLRRTSFIVKTIKIYRISDFCVLYALISLFFFFRSDSWIFVMKRAKMCECIYVYILMYTCVYERER